MRRYCRFGGIFVAGCTGDCHSDNFRCGRWRRLRRDRQASVSVNHLWALDEFAHIDTLTVYPDFMIALRYHWLVYFDLISFQFLVFHLEYYSSKHYSYWEFHIVFTIICKVLLLVYFMYHYLVPLFICISVFSIFYWKSGTGDFLVLMLFVLQYIDCKLNFLTLTFITPNYGLKPLRDLMIRRFWWNKKTLLI